MLRSQLVNDSLENPTRFLVDFPPQRGKHFLAILDVSADQIPAPWKQPARHRTSLHEYSSPIVGDKGTRNQLLFGYHLQVYPY